MRVTVGRSSGRDPRLAIVEAVNEALADATAPVVAFVFTTSEHDPVALARAASEELGALPWVGCSAAGVFARTELLLQGVVVGIVSSPHARVHVGSAGPVSADARACGRAAAAEAIAGAGPPPEGSSRSLIVLTDALRGDPDEVVRGAAEEGGAGVVWAGGGAGDNLGLVRCVQFAHGHVLTDHVVIVSIEAPGEVAAGIRHGWRPYGPPTLVTRSRGPVAVELEYEDALSVYRRTAELKGDHVDPAAFSQFAMTHPLGIPQADGEHVIRDPLAIERDGGLRCVGEVPDGCIVRVMEGSADALVEAGDAAARSARAAVHGPVGGALVFDCVSRYLILGSRFTEELARIQSGLGPDTPFFGCLTFGEVGALGQGVPQFHNKTAVVLALEERDAKARAA